MWKRKWTLAAICLLVMFNGCTVRETKAGLFSWKKDAVESWEMLLSDAKSLEITEVYQNISDSLESDTVKSFLNEAAKQQVNVYLLAGEAEWALEEERDELIEEIDRLAVLNTLVEEEAQIKGIMLDVEPYLLEEWEEDSDEIMQSYVENMRCAYTYAREQGITMVLCIPYFYNNKGYEKELELLIAEACDEVAVMNYYRDAETSNIKEEAAYAGKYGKPITTIYEMKEAGTHGLTEQNTYYNFGFEAVRKNYAALCEIYKEQEIKMAYHDYEAVKEVMKNE